MYNIKIEELTLATPFWKIPKIEALVVTNLNIMDGIK